MSSRPRRSPGTQGTVRRARRSPPADPFRGRPADKDEPIRVREGQPLEEHDLDEAEDRRAGADGERERRDDDEGEARRAGKTARGMREVPGPSFQHSFHRRSPFALRLWRTESLTLSGSESSGDMSGITGRTPPRPAERKGPTRSACDTFDATAITKPRIWKNRRVRWRRRSDCRDDATTRAGRPVQD